VTLATEGVMTFDVNNNTMSGANGSAVTLQKASTGNPVTDTGTLLNGKFDNNTIGVSGVTDSGSKTGNGLFWSFAGGGTIDLLVRNNIIQQYHGNGGIYADNTGGSYTVNTTITGNTVRQPGAGAFAGLALTAGAQNPGGNPGNGDQIHVCAIIGGAGALENDFSTGDPSNANDIIIGGGASGGSQMRLPGESAANEAQLQAFVLANNNVAGTTVTAYEDPPATFSSTFTGTGTSCP
jgi:hypothetical protein